MHYEDIFQGKFSKANLKLYMLVYFSINLVKLEKFGLGWSYNDLVYCFNCCLGVLVFGWILNFYHWAHSFVLGLRFSYHVRHPKWGAELNWCQRWPWPLAIRKLLYYVWNEFWASSLSMAPYILWQHPSLQQSSESGLYTWISEYHNVL